METEMTHLIVQGIFYIIVVLLYVCSSDSVKYTGYFDNILVLQ